VIIRVSPSAQKGISRIATCIITFSILLWQLQLLANYAALFEDPVTLLLGQGLGAVLVDNTETIEYDLKSIILGAKLTTLGFNSGIAHAQIIGIRIALDAGADVIALFVITILFHNPARYHYKLRNCFLLFRKKNIPFLFTTKQLVFVSRTLLLFSAHDRWSYVKAYLSALLDGVRRVEGPKPG
jgi:hypothetical protein